MPDGATVLVEGLSLTDSGFSDGGGYLADATGGIAILLSDGTFPRGMTLRVQGELDQRFSQRTIRADTTDVTIVGPGTEPTAATVATGSVGEAHEGELVELDGVIVSGQTALTSGIAVDLDDGSGPIRVMVGAATGIDVTGWTRDTRLHLRGVVGQRDSSGSGTAGYRVQPRDAADILAVTPPATPSPSPSPNPSATPVPSANPAVLSIAAARAMGVNTRLTVRGVVTLPAGLAEPGRSRHPGLVGRHPAAAGRRSRQPQARRAGRGGRYPIDAVGHGDHPRHRAGSQAGPPGTTRPDAPLHRRLGRGAGSDAGRGPRGSDAHATPHQRAERLLRHRRRIGAAQDLRQSAGGHPDRRDPARIGHGGGWRARPGDDRQAAGPRISALAARILGHAGRGGGPREHVGRR